MTQEEKAKAYDEAFEKAREKYNSKYHPSEGPSGVYLNNVDLEEIFPALKESEDERIRKGLIELVTNDKVAGFTEFYEKRGTTCDDVIAYLEKQKEATPCSVDEFTLTLRNCLSTDSELTKEQADIFATVYGKELLNVAIGKVKSGLTKEDIDDFKTEKQKEQKPAQYDLDVLEKHITKDSISELAHTVMIRNGWDIVEKEQKPEEKPINWTELTWEDINELEEIINKVHYEFRAGIGQESFGKEVLEQFREYKGDEYLDEIEQKPTEWSEEDETMLRTIISDGSRGVELDSKQISWLKSLLEKFNLQPKQEWSEEDEHCIELLDTIIDSSALIPKNKIKCHAFLKSLHS